VEVDDEGVGFVAESIEQGVDLVEGRAGRVQEDGAREVDHADSPAGGLDDRVAPAGVGGPVVRRSDHAVGAVEVFIGVAMPVDVVSRGDDVDAGVEDLPRGLLGDPEAPRRVLAVRDHEVGGVALAQPGHRERQAVAPRAPADVADEQDDHRASVKRRYLSGP